MCHNQSLVQMFQEALACVVSPRSTAGLLLNTRHAHFGLCTPDITTHQLTMPRSRQPTVNNGALGTAVFLLCLLLQKHNEFIMENKAFQYFPTMIPQYESITLVHLCIVLEHLILKAAI